MTLTLRLAAFAALLLTLPPALADREVKLGVDQVMLEAGAFADADAADRAAYLRLNPYANWKPSRTWELHLGGRIDAVDQSGGVASFGQARVRLGESFVRYRSAGTRVTLGLQTIVWGRVDATPVIDRVSRVDLQRFALDDLQDRRLPHAALRLEQDLGDYRFDAVLLPRWRNALLPDVRSVWSPINRLAGEVVGVPATPAFSAFVSGAQLRKEEPRSGGGALRVTRTGVGSVDLGFTLARTRQPLPYFRLDAAEGALTAVHPYNSFVGVDAEFSAWDVTWRTELGWTRGILVTQPSGLPLQARQTEWIAGAELFPGGGDTRLTLQVLGRWVHASGPILERKRYYGLNGEVQTPLAQDRWRLALGFFAGLNVNDLYLAPKLSFVGWEPHEFYVAARLFDGEERTLGGFHRRHDMLAVGLNTRF
jgi:hypothetical protein